MLLEKLKETVVDENIKECKGLYWRAYVSSYLSSYNSIEVRKSLRLLTRKSCSGCDKCEWIWEYLNDDILAIAPCEYIGEIENGKIYTYNVVTSQGYYDKYPEIDRIEFVEVKE